MAVKDSTICAYRVPGQKIFQDGPGARFGIYSGFSLIELLVVIGVIAVLAAILFPTFTAAQATGKRAKCISNLKQITSAWQTYADDNGGRACPAYYTLKNDPIMHSWDVTSDPSSGAPSAKLGLLGPYLKTSAINACPLVTKGGWDRVNSGYAYNATYVGGFFAYSGSRLIARQSCMLSEIAQPSRTAVFADAGYDNPVQPCNWLRAPGDALYDAGTVHFRHNATACVAYADGHVAAVKTKYNYNEGAPECGALSEDDSAYDLK